MLLHNQQRATNKVSKGCMVAVVLNVWLLLLGLSSVVVESASFSGVVVIPRSHRATKGVAHNKAITSSCRPALKKPSPFLYFAAKKRGFLQHPQGLPAAANKVDADKEEKNEGELEYRNVITNILSNFLKTDDETTKTSSRRNDPSGLGKQDPLAEIDFGAPKLINLAPNVLAQQLDAELYEKEWFVTGRVNPSFFSPEFTFQDPDVTLKGIEDYARGVYKLFDQETSRAEIISTVVTNKSNANYTITVTWRLSGKVNIGPGLTIKPYICYSDFTVDPTDGLIVFQEDRFDIPGWDILLSALFPFLIGRVTAPPAPPVEPRSIPTKTEVTTKANQQDLPIIKKFFSFFQDN